MDEAILRFYSLSFDQVMVDPHAEAIIDRCRQQGVPVLFNRYVNHGDLATVTRRIREDQRFQGIIFYETCCFIDFQPDGSCIVRDDFEVPQAVKIV